ncbi:MAG TPA: AMMECR1 domain-containing protein [Spirochaetota bacterium]|jgi:AMMECR1 domain-containing protein|nr:AMMECR1 domain-containing protein [Spirochaetota bacterium]
MKRLILISFFIILSSVAFSNSLRDFELFSRSRDCDILINWLKDCSYAILKKEEILPPPKINFPSVYGRNGLFVTLIKDGTVRGCFGAFDHSIEDSFELLVGYLREALYSDPRYRPLELYELDDMEIIITVTSRPQGIDEIDKIDISKYGIFIQCDGDNTVIVPAEYRTHLKIFQRFSSKDCHFSKFDCVTIRRLKQ